MHGKIFANLSFDELAQQLGMGRAEPDRAGSASRLAPEASPQMRHTAAAGRPVGNLLYLVFVGLVASATIGVFFGIGFFLLVQPSREVIVEELVQAILHGFLHRND